MVRARAESSRLLAVTVRAQVGDRERQSGRTWMTRTVGELAQSLELLADAVLETTEPPAGGPAQPHYGEAWQ